MATVPGLPLRLNDVCAVFGAPAGTPLHDFYRGGPWVPNIPQNANVPTAPPIQLAQLVGATNYVPISGLTVNNVTDEVPASQVNNTFGNASANFTGGNGSYTYQFQYVSGTNFVINTPTHIATSFTHSARPPAGTYTGTYRFTVSDGVSSQSVNFTVTSVRD